MIIKRSFRLLASLSLLLAPFSGLAPFFSQTVRAAADTCTWTGGGSDDNFSTAANWSGCDNGIVPEDGDSLVFGIADATPNNDLGLMVLANLTFDATTTISGDPLGFGGSTITVNGQSSINTNVLISDSTTVTGPSGLTIGESSTHELEFMSSLGSLTNSGSVAMTIESSIIGDGTINQDNEQSLLIYSDNSTFDGDINVLQGQVLAHHMKALGSATGETIVSNDARVLYYLSSSQGANPTIDEPFTLGEALDVHPFTNFTLGVYTETEQTFTFSGPIVLTANTLLMPSSKADMKLTGSLTGAFTVAVGEAMEGSIIIASSPNSSQTANGTYKTAVKTYTLSDSQPSAFVSVYYGQIMIVTGVRDTVNVADGGVLKGTGTVDTVTIGVGGRIAPGLSPGCLNTGNLNENGIYEVEIGGTTACTSYDQTVVTGTVALGAVSELNLLHWNNFRPAAGNTFTIISNDGADAVTGTFQGLAQGATVTVDGVTYQISYTGGDGNDVVLTAITVPAVPATGSKPAATMTVLVLLGFAILGSGAAMLSYRKR